MTKITDCITKKNPSQETKTTAQEYRRLIEMLLNLDGFKSERLLRKAYTELNRLYCQS